MVVAYVWIYIHDCGAYEQYTGMMIQMQMLINNFTRADDAEDARGNIRHINKCSVRWTYGTEFSSKFKACVLLIQIVILVRYSLNITIYISS